MTLAITKAQVIKLIKIIKNLIKKEIKASFIVRTGRVGWSESVFPTLWSIVLASIKKNL